MFDHTQVLILAADSEDDQKYARPRCFSTMIGAVTLIERQLRTLALYGFKRQDITIVIGNGGAWNSSNYSSAAEQFGCRVLSNDANEDNRSCSSLLLGLKNLDERANVLVISGDLVFDTKHLDLLNIEEASGVLVRQAIRVGEVGELIESKNGRVSPKNSDSPNFPWYLFSGMAFLKKDLVDAVIKSAPASNKSYIGAIVPLAAQYKIICFDYTSPRAEIHAYDSGPKDLTGGSFAGLRKRQLIRKSATGKGVDKVVDEINWLRALPPELKSYFPVVVDYKISHEEAWFDMPFYDYSNIRKGILNGSISLEKVILLTEKILDFCFNNLYSRHIGVPGNRWIDQVHLNRVESRMQILAMQSKELCEIICQPVLYINNKIYRNIPELFFGIKNNVKCLNANRPSSLTMIHGDLHYQNILYTDMDTNQPFIFADPRGELDGSDKYYDLGKLWHSFNGKYDLIHTDQYQLRTCEKEPYKFELSLGDRLTNDFYDKLHAQVKELVADKFETSLDQDWLMRVKFNEVMHFSSVIIFHLQGDKNENRAKVLYLRAVQLINEFYRDYGDMFQLEDTCASKQSRTEFELFSRTLTPKKAN